jgi:primase-polymerase (primpol)-like protein
MRLCKISIVTTKTKLLAVTMIFQTAFLTSLLASAAALTTDTVTVTKDVKEIQKVVKSQIREKFSSPASMSGKLEKFQKIQAKPSSIDLETTKFDETPTHLRGLKMRDNFLSFSFFSDDQCTMPIMQFGSLVNTCANEKGTNTGEKKSSMLKVNKKENLIVELEYKGYDCKVFLHLSSACLDHLIF